MHNREEYDGRVTGIRKTNIGISSLLQVVKTGVAVIEASVNERIECTSIEDCRINLNLAKRDTCLNVYNH